MESPFYFKWKIQTKNVRKNRKFINLRIIRDKIYDSSQIIDESSISLLQSFNKKSCISSKCGNLYQWKFNQNSFLSPLTI